MDSIKKNITKMTLGIAIPTYLGHLHHLENLLNQISKSTVLPKQVSVSISSYDGEISLCDYPFELILTKNKKFQNVSQNCNISASKLSTDIISFFGGDDIPHIKRNEYLLEAFKQGSNAVVHNYINSGMDKINYQDDIGDIELYVDYIDTYVSDQHFPISSKDSSICYANGPITITKKIFDDYKYDENNTYFKREDSVYNSNLVKKGYKISYIKNNLMLYIH